MGRRDAWTLEGGLGKIEGPCKLWCSKKATKGNKNSGLTNTSILSRTSFTRGGNRQQKKSSILFRGTMLMRTSQRSVEAGPQRTKRRVAFLSTAVYKGRICVRAASWSRILVRSQVPSSFKWHEKEECQWQTGFGIFLVFAYRADAERAPHGARIETPTKGHVAPQSALQI